MGESTQLLCDLTIFRVFEKIASEWLQWGCSGFISPSHSFSADPHAAGKEGVTF
jgi:hypothetical protein